MDDGGKRFSYFQYGMDMEGRYSIVRRQDEEGVPIEDCFDTFDGFDEAKARAEMFADEMFFEYLWVIEGDADFLANSVEHIIVKGPYIQLLRWYRPSDDATYLAYEVVARVSPAIDVRAGVEKLQQAVAV